MSNDSDPTAVLTVLDRAQDAFEMVGRGRTAFEDGISADEDWKTQLTKACRLLEVVDTLQSQDGYYTAVIEVCFGAIERSIEAYALAMTNDTLQDFQNHQFSIIQGGASDLKERAE
ncbi:DNA-binding protein [Halobellus litoreus]|uniref:DNA-binding protein n=1 Tax=Halobellus litoreus TaxID=755310 RepID=A0ABD6E201_9EURY|nr:DNA-binding protein [Halobellus litoreus]